MTETKSYVNIESCTTVLSADQQPKEEIMLDQQKITIFPETADNAADKAQQ